MVEKKLSVKDCYEKNYFDFILCEQCEYRKDCRFFKERDNFTNQNGWQKAGIKIHNKEVYIFRG